MSMDFAGFKSAAGNLASTYFPVEAEINVANGNGYSIIDTLGLGDFEQCWHGTMADFEAAIARYYQTRAGFKTPLDHWQMYMERMIPRLELLVIELKANGCDMVQLA